jgi:hypothetical protein
MITEHPRCPVCDAPQEVERLKQELSDITLAVDAAADQCDLLPIFDTPAKKIQALGDLAQSYKEDYDESCGALKQANARAARSDSYAEGLLGRIQQHNRDLAEQCAARKCHFKEYDLRCPECPKDYELEMTDADLAPPSNVIPTTPQEPPIYGGAFAFDHRAGTLTPVASIPTGAPEPKVDHVFPLYPDTRPEIDTSSRKRLAKLAERCRTSDVRPAEVAMILESVLSAPQRDTQIKTVVSGDPLVAAAVARIYKEEPDPHADDPGSAAPCSFCDCEYRTGDSKPLVNVTDDGDLCVEWWKGERKLTCYAKPDYPVLFVDERGPGESSMTIAQALQWLHQSDNTGCPLPGKNSQP